MHKRSFLSPKAMTIVESMTAMMILATLMTSVLTVSARSFRYLTDIRTRGAALQVAQQKMEEIRLLTWSQMQSLPQSFADSSGRYTGTIRRSVYDSFSGTPTVYRVSVTVTWKNRGGQPTTSTLTTLVSNGGLNNYLF